MFDTFFEFLSASPEKGAAAGVTATLRDFSGSAGLYFVRIRTPATTLAGSALAAFFAFSKFNMEHKTPTERFLVKLYHGFVVSCFLLSFNVLVVSTNASIAVMDGNFDKKATSAFALLQREFDYEFTMTRWCYSVSLLCFLTAVTLRAILEFQLLQPHLRNQAKALFCIMTALISHLVSHVNQTLISFRNLLQMTLHVLELAVQKSHVEQDPFQYVSIIATMLAAYYGIKALLTEYKQKQE